MLLPVRQFTSGVLPYQVRRTHKYQDKYLPFDDLTWFVKGVIDHGRKSDTGK